MGTIAIVTLLEMLNTAAEEALVEARQTVKLAQGEAVRYLAREVALEATLMQGLRFKVASGEATLREQVLATEPMAMTIHLVVVMVALEAEAASTLMAVMAESLEAEEAAAVLPVEVRLMAVQGGAEKSGCGFTDERNN